MIDILRSVVTLAIVLITGVADMAHAQLDDDSPSQLRLIDLPQGGPSMRTIATAGFPAIAASGTEIAVLRSLDAGEVSVALDVMRVDGGDVLNRFVLFPEHGGGS